ncbi:hypothetical protein ASF09_19160 [Sphingomonas sp. Leaf242]|nr:hypothetical protein ASF09_19160 [Sphingomonas sp. Leaf242]
MLYARGIEDILGDMRAESLMRPFQRYTNLHSLIHDIALDVVTDEIDSDIGEAVLIRRFFEIFDVAFDDDVLADEESFWTFANESERFYRAIDELSDEVFHILFADLIFLQRFNALCAGYIEQSGFGEDHRTSTGTLRRVNIPVWARRAVFHRDHGECRSCKRSLAAVINRLETERYDHIVPLARFGPNDVTNLQLLCEPCNSAKSARQEAVSSLYPRAFSQ